MQHKYPERWKPVVGYELIYVVSSFGRVRRIGAAKGATVGIILKPQKLKNGYLAISLCNKIGQKSYLIHDLVTAAFFGQKPTGYNVNHKDGIKINNYLHNLEYATPSENSFHAYRVLGIQHRGRAGSSNPYAKLHESDVQQIKTRLTRKDSNISISRDFNVSATTIGDIKRGRTWGHIV